MVHGIKGQLDGVATASNIGEGAADYRSTISERVGFHEQGATGFGAIARPIGERAAHRDLARTYGQLLTGEEVMVVPSHPRNPVAKTQYAGLVARERRELRDTLISARLSPGAYRAYQQMLQAASDLARQL